MDYKGKNGIAREKLRRVRIRIKKFRQVTGQTPVERGEPIKPKIDHSGHL
jgi:hypothetical protein